MRTYVLLPVNKEVFDFIAEQVAARGQPDRVEGNRVDLSDVHIEWNEAQVLRLDTTCTTCHGKKTVKERYGDPREKKSIQIPCPMCKGKGRIK